MEADIFRDVLVPVIGGLGIFMLGLEFMANGIQSLAVNKMRAFLAKTAGTPVKGLFAGTLITGVIQSSTAMTVMVVGLVNAGVLGLRPAISVIMGANIGTTLGNGLIALPLGPLGLILAGIFALVYCFAKSDRVRNIALACMGFALIFYGLNLMTGGLRPLRNMPEVMSVLSALNANDFVGVIWCVLIAALITAMIHSSSATIGIVMGLGSAGVIDWQAAVACSLGADLGTTITSWMASLNLSKNAKRAAYAHITFNFLGVAIMLPLFFLSMQLLVYVMGFFGGDPGIPVMVEGKETYPLVPVAVGLYSTAFNIFNTALMFPFLGVFYNVLSKIGHSSVDDREDYGIPRYLDASAKKDIVTGVQAVQRESDRYLQGAGQLMAIARGADDAPDDSQEHYASLDVLSREIRDYTAAMFQPDMLHAKADLLASLIEEEDWTASLGETLYQIARRVERQPFSTAGRALVDETLDEVSSVIRAIAPNGHGEEARPIDAATPLAKLQELRAQALRLDLAWAERGSILTLLGSAERAFYLIERIEAERKSVPRTVVEGAKAKPRRKGGMEPAPVPAE
jgi:phosphate:Na+ symporter